MNRNTNRLIMIAAATLTLGVSAAYGQEKLIAQVPFDFKAGSVALSAGSYSVTRIESPSGRLMQIRDEKTLHSVLVTSAYPVQAKSNGDGARARMVFACGQTGCALAQTWLGGGQGSAFNRAKNAGEMERMATVYLTPNATAGE